MSGQWRIKPSYFGDYIEIAMPTGCDMLLVCVDTVAHMPVAICLPHQLYVKWARELLDRHGARTLTVMPYSNAGKVEIDLQAAPTEASA